MESNNINVLSDKKILEFPIGISSADTDEYGLEKQYMLFKINSDEKTSKLRDDKSNGAVVVTSGRTGSGVATETAQTAVNTDDDAKHKYGETDVKKEKWTTQKGMQRLDKVIVLPMPNEHTVRTSVSYNSEYEPSLLTKAGDMLNRGAGDLVNDAKLYAKGASIAFIVNKLVSGVTSKEAQFAEDRIALNPKKEVMFDSFGFRKFSFSYIFSPKNNEEVKMVKSIIETFRYYSLPEISPAKLFYLFPAEFEISFMQGQKDNPHLPKITTSVLQSINVNYMPQSVWSTLPDGSPLSVQIGLEFLELELVDRNRIYNKNSIITSGY